ARRAGRDREEPGGRQRRPRRRPPGAGTAPLARSHGGRPGQRGINSVQRDVQDLVVAVVRCAVPVAAGRREPQAAVRARLDGKQPAELAGEERLRGRGTAALDLHDPQPHAAQRRHVERVVDDRQPARRGLRHRPGPLRRDEPAAVADRALARRPAEVAALLDQVQLVLLVVAQLGLPEAALRVERQALDVAVPEAPHVVVERVVGRDAAVRVHPQDLAVEAVLVLRVVAVLRVADADVQLAVRAEPQPALGRTARPHGMSASLAMVFTAPGPPPPPFLVFAVTLLLRPDALPARSRARTWNVNDVLAARLPTVAVVVLASVDATGVLPPFMKTSYPPRPMPPVSSLDAFHASEMVL